MQKLSLKSKEYSIHDLALLSGGSADESYTKYDGFLSEEHRSLFETFSEHAFSYIFMTDYRYMKYIYISPGVRNVLGYNHDFLLNQGLEFSFKSIHPDDRQKLKIVHQKMFEYFYSLPNNERKNLKFDYNLRIKTADYKFIQLLHQISFVKLSENGDPLLDYSTCTDISRYKTDNLVKLTIYKYIQNTFKQVYEYDLPDAEISLTKRQAEIMELISQGFTSKEIAEKLFISYDTVKNHRRKIISNTCTKNMAQSMMVMYGKKNYSA